MLDKPMWPQHFDWNKAQQARDATHKCIYKILHTFAALALAEALNAARLIPI
jgi:hypothetical protein